MEGMSHSVVTMTKERDVRPHASFWHTSRCLLDRGEEQEKASYHQFMASLVFTAFTFEAYLNWLGTQIFPHWNYLERLSPKEKLELIADHLKVSIDNGKRPWQTIKRLFGFRNDVAHGKPEAIATETTEPNDERLDGKLGELARTDWELYCSLENAERAREDVEEILKALHAAAVTASYLKDRLGPFQRGLQMHSAVLRSGGS
jgi:hypothetical protein